MFWLAPILALNAMANPASDFVFHIEDGGAVIDRYIGPGGAVVIPSSLGGRTVKSFGAAFYQAIRLTSITIPDSVTSIRSSAFDGCANLASVTIGGGVTSLGAGAFSDCTSLTGIVVPESVTSIESTVFAGCTNLASVTIGRGVTSIGYYAFLRCLSLTDVMIPPGVTSIGYGAFSLCPNLRTIEVDALNPAFASKEGVLFNKAQSVLVQYPGGSTGPYYVPNGITSIEFSAFAGCSGLTSVALPSTLISLGYGTFSGCTGLTNATIGNGLNVVSGETFFGCASLVSISIPDSVTSIEERAFYGCSNLTRVTMGGGVTSIADSAFAGCGGLEAFEVDALNSTLSSEGGVLFNKDRTTLVKYPQGKIGPYTIPGGVSLIHDSAFESAANLTRVMFAESVTSIGSYAFYGCTGLASMDIRSATSIGTGAFAGCTTLASVVISQVTSIEAEAFYECTSLTEIVIPDSATHIGDRAFFECLSLTSAVIGNNVTDIGYEAFSGCINLRNVTISDSVMVIRDSAFQWCSSLASVATGSNLTYIGAQAFSGCSSLASVTIGSSVTEIGYWAFYGSPLMTFEVDARNSTFSSIDGVLLNKDQSVLIQYPRGRAGPYTMPMSVTSIRSDAFSGSSGLTSVTLPDTLITLESYTFRDCTGLTSVTIGNGLSVISYETFFGCAALVSITLPDSVTSIEERAFYGCTNLSSVAIGSGVTSIVESAFFACAALAAFEVDARNSAFSSEGGVLFNKDRTTLVQYPGGKTGPYVIPNGVTSIELSAFSGRSGLTSVAIPQSVTRMGGFFDCTGLSSVTMGGGVTRINDYTFSGCLSLTNVVIGSSVASIGRYAFDRCVSLPSITVPASVTSIEDWVFSGCQSLTTIQVEALNPTYGSQDGVLFSKDLSVLVRFPEGKAGPYIIPTTITSVRHSAFSGCRRLSSITIPSRVTYIGNYAFGGCNSLASAYFEGYPPNETASQPFAGAPFVTIFYRADVAGWGASYSGRPTAVWLTVPDYAAWSQSTGLATHFPSGSNAQDDPDIDGLTNDDERIAGTDPIRRGSVLALDLVPRLEDLTDDDRTPIPTGKHALYLNSAPGRYYGVYHATDPRGPWQLAATGIARSAQTRFLVLQPQAIGFYRVRVE